MSAPKMTDADYGVMAFGLICLGMLAAFTVSEPAKTECTQIKHDTDKQVTCWVDTCGQGGAHAGISCLPDNYIRQLGPRGDNRP